MKVLIVDDEKEIASLLQDYLETQGGYEVTVAYSGEDALDQIPRQMPDLIILDILLPGLSGFQILDALKKDPKTQDIPVLLASITEGPEHQEKKRLGIIDFLRKPIDFEKLNQIIQDLRQSSQFLGKRSVLVIDDDEECLDLVVAGLKDMGCLVSTALDGEKGLRLARELHPDMIMLDYLLPNTNGIDVIKQLKSSKETCDIPVVLLSAYVSSEDKGKSYFLLDYKNTGPLSLEEMCRKVKDILTIAV